MLLERTIAQLDIGRVPAERAEELGHLGYVQWLSGLAPTSNYVAEAARAHATARPFAATSPAVAVFCDLLVESCEAPVRPLRLILPPNARRGGAEGRRARWHLDEG